MNRKDQPTHQDPTLIGNEKPRKDNEDPSWRPSETERKPEPEQRKPGPGHTWA